MWTNGTSRSLPVSFATPAVAPEHDDLVAGVEELVGHRGELRPPVAVERVEDVRPDLGEAAIGPAVGQSLRLLPLDPSSMSARTASMSPRAKASYDRRTMVTFTAESVVEKIGGRWPSTSS